MINMGRINLSLAATVLVAVLSGSSIICDPHPWAENVCNTTTHIKKDKIIEQPVQYEIKVQSMCNLLPCTKTRVETRIDQTIKTVLVPVERATCCPGYTETPERQCAPICLQSCNNGGRCVAPGACKCFPEPTDSSPGFVGPTCNRFVCANDDKWGARCDKPCKCFGSSSYCVADTGKCACYPGWRGPNCTLECDPFSHSAECKEINRLPPIIEPETNLMSANLVLERQQQPEALVLDDEVKKVEDAHDWRGLMTNYAIVGLSLVSLISIAAFLVIRRRYKRIRNELYYTTSAYAGSSSTYSEPPPYDSADQGSSSSTAGSMVVPSNSRNLEKNFSFATATRNILLGKDLNSLHSNQNKTGDARNKMVFHPRVESHLINSQKQAEHNVYTSAVVDMRDSSKAPAPNRPLSPPAYSAPEDHIYQVPKTASSSGPNSSGSSDESLLPHNVSSNETLEDDSTSNIYEELKPRRL